MDNPLLRHFAASLAYMSSLLSYAGSWFDGSPIIGAESFVVARIDPGMMGR